MATWYVEDIEQIVDDLTAVGVQFLRYDELQHDARGSPAGLAGGRIAWLQDRDGNLLAIETDV